MIFKSLVSRWRLSHFGARQQLDMAYITPCRNTFGIEHKASAVFVAF